MGCYLLHNCQRLVFKCRVLRNWKVNSEVKRSVLSDVERETLNTENLFVRVKTKKGEYFKYL